ncbi:site-2 protease family protein [Sulfuriflexus sp.]|uniref:site-2 protease family protein n=1 Tax=Sulfuriflexus sp. TaxID=2015443 RepID=UPI0028CCDD5E|nr:site-2 protease family protein [Sulfuriflexus sp.]MDT8404778.1 site-2 protease family protein [Sulfuriflexus sp.]
MFTELSPYQLFAIAVLPTLFAIVVHEVAHGWVANRLGDNTAYMLGRLTLNPLKHIDPVGTILVPALLIFTVGFAFGWAKPVPINWNNLRHPKRDMALVAAAGPGANLLMAIGWGLVAKIASLLPADLGYISEPFLYMGLFGILINIVLMVFNLLPIPPTDGGRLASSLLPPRLSRIFDRVEPYGLFILLALLLSGVLWQVIGPVVNSIMLLIQTLTGLR